MIYGITALYNYVTLRSDLPSNYVTLDTILLCLNKAEQLCSG